MKESAAFLFRVLSPIHVGCDEVYEPVAFTVDEKANRLNAFDPFDFMKTLDGGAKRSFLEICRKGTIASILEIYKFMRGKQCIGKPVEVCSGFIEHYRKTLSIPLQGSRRIQQELSNFAIARTAFIPSDERPYIPGSAIKGALRTAYLNALAAASRVRIPGGRSAGRDLESKLLDTGSIETDPFRLLKVSDFMPVGEIRTRVVYAVNEKKKRSGYEARGPFQILEVIEPGSLFEGSISVIKPERGAGIKQPLTFEGITQSARSFYSGELGRESAELANIGVNFKCRTDPGDVFTLRIGRHSGAECMTIEGHRAIKIMQGRGQEPKFEKNATTLWLVSDQPKAVSKAELRPFGWGSAGLMTQEMVESCSQKERDYQLARKAQREGQPQTGETGPGDVHTDPAPEPEPALGEIWNGAVLAWSPGNQVLSASFEGRKATCTGKELVPDILHDKLFVRKRAVSAIVTVERCGNAFRIKKVETLSDK